MPTLSEVHVDAAMTEFSLAYHNGLLIAEEVLPPIFVSKESGKYFKHDKDSMREEDDGPRGVKESAAEVDHGLSTVDYQLHEYSLKELVPDRIRDNADQPLDPDEEATQNVTDKMLLKKEIRAEALVFSTTNVTQNTTLSGNDQWDSGHADSTPLTDIETGMETVRAAVGVRPNAAVISANVWSDLKYHSTLTDLFKYTAGGKITVEQFASLIDIPAANIRIADAIKNTANENQSDSLSDVWANDVLLYYRNPNPGRKSLTFGATIRKRADRQVTAWRVNDPPGEYKRVAMMYNQVLIEEKCGYYIKDAV
jgi:hypothetical protein